MLPSVLYRINSGEDEGEEDEDDEAEDEAEEKDDEDEDDEDEDGHEVSEEAAGFEEVSDAELTEDVEPVHSDPGTELLVSEALAMQEPALRREPGISLDDIHRARTLATSEFPRLFVLSSPISSSPSYTANRAS